MSLCAPEFFAELCLPFRNSTIVGNTYYAAPAPSSPLRLRIAFTGSIHADTYTGLRLAVVHADKGEMDSVVVSFLDHGTFHRRDEAQRTPANTKRYATFDRHHRPGHPPWEGAVTAGLRDAIERYTAVWFPGAWEANTPRRAAGPTTHKAPLPAAQNSSRAR
ncbi:hypothetical protein [Streptomyces sp. NPDC059604]|uniref:hypothetical protein n=1 Tax=Streptomyces sp. NPDC059604 TaxID=3346881 RepID=UPI0036CF290A